MVSGLEVYRDPENNFKLSHRVLPEISMYVIVPDYDDSLELVPTDTVGFARAQQASLLAKQGELGSPAFLTESSLTESYAKGGLRVVFSGSIGSSPFQIDGLNRLPLHVTEIELAASP